jgi:hypothetical protein
MNEETWTDEKILRKINQAYELAGCARQDQDHADEKRWLDEVERLKKLLRERQ